MTKQQKINTLRKLEAAIEDEHFHYLGLCTAIYALEDTTKEEKQYLRSIIPKGKKGFSGYYWTPGEKLPRLALINEKIRELYD